MEFFSLELSCILPGEINGLVLALLATHVVVCLVPRTSKMLANQQTFLSGREKPA